MNALVVSSTFRAWTEAPAHSTLTGKREVPVEARREAYGTYRARLREYRGLRNGGASDANLRTLRDAIMTITYPTVWREMQRQHLLVDELRALFLEVPEALDW